MTHVHQSMWPKAFEEGKRLADGVLAMNRKLKKFRKAEPEEVPSDRELALSAALNIYDAFRQQQYAASAARRITLEKALRFLEQRAQAMDDLEPRRLARAVKKVLARTEGDSFLAMWLRVEQWLTVASTPEYWKQFDNNDPSTVIRALVEDLASVAHQGEESNGKEGQEAGSNDPQGTPGTEGDQDQAEQAADRPAVRPSSGPDSGTHGGGEGVRGGGEGMEAPQGGVQEPREEPPAAGGQAPDGGQVEGGHDH